MFARSRAAAALLCLAVSACTPTLNNPTGWGQIAAGVGAIIGETKIDPQIEKVSAKLANYCTTVQTSALAVDFLAPEKVQQAAKDARIVVATFCASLPNSVATAITSLAAAYAAIEAAKRG